ncbi:MAG: type II toxin-antitoxin system YafQ family toxin [Lachnospiraceae bacterium]|nr:type II toxin-antitoxin system YafQ family toxin [Lachnospiraceae bacterium]
MKETKYTVKYTTQFKREYKLAMKRGLKIEFLDEIIAKLALGEKLDIKHHDHALSGNWSGHRECHILPDWLLIYRIEEEMLVLSLTRTGSHNDLFRK